MICEVVAIDAGDNSSGQKSNKQDGVRKTQKRKGASLEPESKDVEIESLGKELDRLCGLYKEVMGQGVPLNLQHCGNNVNSTLQLVFFGVQQRSVRLRVSCAAKPETVEKPKVCTIVRKQLALPDDSEVTVESKFSALGADSLDTVEIVMGLEEEFGISVEEDSAQTIATVQDAVELIEKLIEKNKA